MCGGAICTYYGGQMLQYSVLLEYPSHKNNRNGRNSVMPVVTKNVHVYTSGNLSSQWGMKCLTHKLECIIRIGVCIISTCVAALQIWCHVEDDLPSGWFIITPSQSITYVTSIEVKHSVENRLLKACSCLHSTKEPSSIGARWLGNKRSNFRWKSPTNNMADHQGQ